MVITPTQQRYLDAIEALTELLKAMKKAALPPVPPPDKKARSPEHQLTPGGARITVPPSVSRSGHYPPADKCRDA